MSGVAIKNRKALELSHYQTEVRNLLVETQAVRENLMLDMIVLQDPTEFVYGSWRCTRPDTGSRKERLHRSVGGSWEEFKSPLSHGGRTRMKGAYWNTGGI